MEEMQYNGQEMANTIKLSSTSKKEICESIRQRDIKIEEQLEAVNSSKNINNNMNSETFDMRIVMESRTVGLQEEKAQNDINNDTIEELNEKACRITEEKMKTK